MKIVVIGACNIDIIGKSNRGFEFKTSNIGQVSVSVGGVGRNIAENLGKLGADVDIITIIPESFFGEIIQASLFRNNIGFMHSVIGDYEDSLYVSMEDQSGEMIGAINQMNSIEQLTPEIIKTQMDFMDIPDIIVIDTNLKQDTIEYIARNKGKSLLAVEAVSNQKVKKVISIINHIDILKVNELEALALLDIDEGKSGDYEELVKNIVDMGVKEVHLTAGSEGMIVGSSEGVQHFEVEKIENVISVNQVGDTYFAGIVYQTLYNKSIREKVSFASNLAKKKLLGDEINVE